ncbi:KPN_02809 family neutral zinc metallopeptidase [Moraxella oblonga]|uniref:KPN_02809 family neutral zinc metallopeptidase n=1 Tax=Moraxella oblonga TaxID=200413 RepID=UPI00082D68DE|nr:neutral zinc metallopeptidase [Moraxella oblonga]
MQWKGRRRSDNVEYRGGSTIKKGGIGIGSIIIALILWKVFGINPQTTLGVAEQLNSQTVQTTPVQHTPEQQEVHAFVETVLADTEDVWTPIFATLGKTYVPPKLVVFTGSVQSACGGATSASGPFYCPADQKVYLDTQFFADMKTQMGITGDKQGSSQLSKQNTAGDFAQAYVIAHEVGHHIQTVLGISSQVRQAQAQTNKANANHLSVRQELQADCFAGLWANHNQKRTNFLQKGDIEEALDAAEKIGDDYLQHKAHGHTIPDSFTHGTSEQRKRWFYRGFESGDIQACDTFGVKNI